MMIGNVDDDIAQYIRRTGGIRQRVERLAHAPPTASATTSKLGMSWASSEMHATKCLELARCVRLDHPEGKCHPAVNDLAGRSSSSSSSHNQSRTMKRYCKRGRSLLPISEVAVKIWDAKAKPKPTTDTLDMPVLFPHDFVQWAHSSFNHCYELWRSGHHTEQGVVDFWESLQDDDPVWRRLGRHAEDLGSCFPLYIHADKVPVTKEASGIGVVVTSVIPILSEFSLTIDKHVMYAAYPDSIMLRGKSQFAGTLQAILWRSHSIGHWTC